ncbi:MAG: hypothetical protein ABW154_13755 [Dyella sp.]
MFWLGLAFLAILAIALVERYRPGTLIGGRTIKRPSASAGGYTLEVRDTAKYQVALRALKRGGPMTAYSAQLVSIGSDPSEVQVHIKGQLVGYLPATAARQWQVMPRRLSGCAAKLQEIDGGVHVWLRL